MPTRRSRTLTEQKTVHAKAWAWVGGPRAAGRQGHTNCAEKVAGRGWLSLSESQAVPSFPACADPPPTSSPHPPRISDRPLSLCLSPEHILKQYISPEWFHLQRSRACCPIPLVIEGSGTASFAGLSVSRELLQRHTGTTSVSLDP